MNKVFRVIWNQATQTWTAVSELAKGRAKSSSKNENNEVCPVSLPKLTLLSAVLCSIICTHQSVYAATSGSTGQIKESSTDGLVIGENSTVAGNANSVAVGRANIVNGSSAVGIGGGMATGESAIALGWSAANGGYAVSIAAGRKDSIGPTEADGGADGAAAVAIAKAYAKGSYAVAIAGAKATADDAIAVGQGAKANLSAAVALGKNAKADNLNAVAVGVNTNSTAQAGDSSVAVGDSAVSSGQRSVAVGASTTASGAGSVAVGEGSSVSTSHSVSIGYQANVSGGNDAIAMGTNTKANAENAIAFGQSATAASSSSIAVGLQSNATGDSSVAIGRKARTSGMNEVALGMQAGDISGANADTIVIGANAQVGLDINAAKTAYGGQVNANDEMIVDAKGALGNLTLTNKSVGQSVAIGGGRAGASDNRTYAYGTQSLAIGSDTIAYGDSSIAIGGDDVDSAGSTNTRYTNLAGQKVEGSVREAYQSLTGDTMNSGVYIKTAAKQAATAIGTQAQANDISLAMGTKAAATGVNTVALGTGAKADVDNAVAIGGGSKTEAGNLGTKQLSTTVDGLTFNWAGGDRTLEGDIVSFGAKGYERQLKNVAPGEVSATSTDAINGSQLYVVAKEVARKTTSYVHVNSGKVDQEAGDANTNLGKVDEKAGATGNYAITAGVNAKAEGTSAVAIGQGAAANTTNAIALGTSSKATSSGVAIGSQANSAGTNALAFGLLAQSIDENTIAIGSNANSTSTRTVAIGAFSTASGAHSLAMGNAAQATADQTIAMGRVAKASQQGAIALGDNANASVANAVALGVNSTTQTATNVSNATVNGITYGTFAGATPSSVVSVGSAGNERQIQNVAAGRVTATSTDAINGSQLYAVANQSAAPIVFAANTSSTSQKLGSTLNIKGANNGADITTTAMENNITLSLQKSTAVTAGDTKAVTSDAVNTAIKAIKLDTSGNSGTGSVNLATQKLAVTGENGITTTASAQGITVKIDDTTKQKIDNAASVSQIYNYAHVNDGTTTQQDGDAADSVENKALVGGKGGAAEKGAIAIGLKAKATAADGIAMGTSAQAVSGISIGKNTVSYSGVAIGDSAQSNAETVAIGKNATARNANAEIASTGAIAVGTNTLASYDSTIAIGTNAQSTSLDNIAMGHDAQATGSVALAMGKSARATGTSNIAIGQEANASGEQGGVALGQKTEAERDATAVGTSAQASALQSSAFGKEAKATKTSSLAAGYQAQATGLWASAIGATALAQGDYSLAAGKQAKAIGESATALGDLANASGTLSVALARNARSDAEKSLAMGNDAHVLAAATGGVALGDSAESGAENALAFGKSANASKANAVALGANSTTADAVAVSNVSINNTTFGTFAGNNPTAVVSLGNDNVKRQIQNVAAGRITPNSTDAINGSQLYAVADQASKAISFVGNSGATDRKLGSTLNIKGDGADIQTAAADDTGVTISLQKSTAVTAGDSKAVTSDAVNTAIKAIKLDTSGNSGTGSVNLVTQKLAVTGENGITTTANAQGVTIKIDDTTKQKIDNAASISQIYNYAHVNDGTTTQVDGDDANTAENKALVGGKGGAMGSKSIAIGIKAQANAINAITIGENANTNVQGGIIIGQNATLSGTDDTNRSGTMRDSVVIGNNASAIADASTVYYGPSVVIGKSANTKGSHTVVIGEGASNDNGAYGVAIGAQAKSSDENGQHGSGVAVGYQANAVGGVSVGNAAQANNRANVALGRAAVSTGNGSSAVGSIAKATNEYTIAFGVNANASGAMSSAVGVNSVAASSQGVALGYGAQVPESAGRGVALGALSKADINHFDATSNYFTTVTDAGEKQTQVGQNYNQFAGWNRNMGGAVSVGYKDAERQIQNVAPGRITATSTDAINGSQLYHMIANTGFNVQEKGTSKSRINNGGTINFKDGTLTTVSVTDDDNSSDIQFNVVTGSLTSTNGGLANATDAEQAKVATIGTVVSAVNALGNNTFQLSDGTKDTDAQNLNTAGGLKFNIKGDNKFISTAASGKNINLSVKEEQVKDSAREAVEVLGDEVITVTPSQDETNHKTTYNVAYDGTKAAEVTNLNYTANNSLADTQSVSLSDGLNFTNGTNTTAEVAADGVIKFHAVSGSITAGNTATVKDGDANKLATVKNVADAINAAAFTVSANSADEKQAIKAGDNVDFKQGDNIVISRTGKQFTVATAKTVSFDKVTVGGVVMDKDNGINAGNHKITNVAAGEVDTDAVNVSQLKAAEKAADRQNYFHVNTGDANQSAGNAQTNLGSVDAKGGATATGALAAGVNAQATTNYSIAVGQNAKAQGQNSSVAIGWEANASGEHSQAMGYQAKAEQRFSMAFGEYAQATGGETGEAVAMGYTAKALGQQSLAMGSFSNAAGHNSLALGHQATTVKSYGIAIGDQAKSEQEYAVALGNLAQAAGEHSFAQGYQAQTTAARSIALGTSAQATVADGVAIGANSQATLGAREGYNVAKDNARANSYAGLTGRALTSTLAGVSVGSANHTRQINHVAAGTADDDAVNIAQLRNVNLKIAGDETKTGSDVLLDNQILTVKGAGDSFITTEAKDQTIMLKTTQGDIISAKGGLATNKTNGLATTAVVTTAVNELGNNTIQLGGDTGTPTAQALNTKGGLAFNIKGDNQYVSTEASGTNVTVSVSDKAVKDAAKSVIKVAGSAPISVKKTTDGEADVYTVNYDGTNAAKTTPLTYKANGKDAQAVMLEQGLDFNNGANTTASVDKDGKVTIDVVSGTMQAGNNGKVSAIAGDDSKVATVKNVTDAINNAAWKVTAAKEGGGELETAETDELVKAGDQVKLQVGNNLKLKQVGTAFTYSLNPVLSNLTSAQFVGNGENEPSVQITNKGISIKPSAEDPAKEVALTESGLNNGGNKIINVAAGEISETSTDAVNGSQLKQAADKAKTTVSVNDEGKATNKNLTLVESTKADGHTNYDVKLADKVVLTDSANAESQNNVTLDGKEGRISASNSVSADKTVVAGTDSAKQVKLDGENATLTAGSGENSVKVDGSNATITAGEGDKAVAIDGKNATIIAGNGDNKVVIDGDKGKITVADGITLDGEAHKANIGKVQVDGKDATVMVGDSSKGDNAVLINGKEGTITGLTNTTWEVGKTEPVSGRAATEDQLKAVSDAADVLANNTIQLTGDTGETKKQSLAKKGGIAFNIITGDANKLSTEASKDGIKITPKTTALTVKNNKADIGKDGNPNSLVTAGDVQDAINGVAWRVTAAKAEGTLGELVDNRSIDNAVSADDQVKLQAGDNLTIKQEGATFTYALNKEVKDLSSLHSREINVGGQNSQGKDDTDGQLNIRDKSGNVGVAITSKDSSGQVGIKNKDGSKVDIQSVVGQNEGAKDLSEKTADRIQYTDQHNVTRQVATMEDGMKFMGDSGSLVKRQLNQQLNIKGGITDSSKLSDGNIGVVADGANTLNLKLAKDIKSINSIGGNGKTITFSEHEVKIDGGNVNMSSSRITNLADGKDPTDAVTVRQLDKSITNITNQVNKGFADVNNRMHRMDRDLRAGIAGATALGFIQRPNEAGKSIVSVGVGGYRGENAIAVGYGRNSDNNKISIKVGASMNSRNDVNWGGSVGYQW